MPGLTPGRRWQPAYSPFKKENFGDRALQVDIQQKPKTYVVAIDSKIVWGVSVSVFEKCGVDF